MVGSTLCHSLNPLRSEHPPVQPVRAEPALARCRRLGGVGQLLLLLAVVPLVISACAAPGPGTPLPPLFVFSEAVSTSGDQPLPTPAIGWPSPSTNLVQADGETLEDFLARVADAEFLHEPQGLIAHSTIVDAFNLYRGVSTQPAAITHCWWIYGRQRVAYDAANLRAEWRERLAATPGPAVYFALVGSGSARSNQLLALFDIHDNRWPDDPLDGFRVILKLQDGRWRVEMILPAH